MTTPMTEVEYGDRLVAGARRSAWTLLWVSSGASVAGNVWFAYRVTSGSAAAMLAGAVVPVLLLLGIHLTGGMAAARREGRVHPTAHRVAVAGVAGLVLMVLAASFFALRDLLLLERFHPVAATLMPLSVDVAVVTSTASLFSLAPRLRRGGGRSAALAAPAKARPAAAPNAASAAAAAAPSATRTAAAAATVVRAAASVPAAAALTDAASASFTSAAASPVHHDRAAAIVASGVTAKAVADVALVLQLLDTGASDRRVHAETGIDARTVARIRKADGAAVEPAPTRTLTAAV